MDIERSAAHAFSQVHPEDAARVLEERSREEITLFLEDTPAHVAADVVKQMNTLTAAACLVEMDPGRAGMLLEHLEVEIAVMLLRRVDGEVQRAILERTSGEVKDQLQKVLAYPENTAGAVMDPSVMTLFEDATVKDVLKKVRVHARHLSRYLFVVNRNHRLVGVLTFRELFMARPDTDIASIMHTDLHKLFAYSDLASVLAHPGWFEHYALPVVEENERFVGLLRYRTFQRLKGGHQEKGLASRVDATGAALGELYQIGLSGLVRSVISLTGPTENQ